MNWQVFLMDGQGVWVCEGEGVGMCVGREGVGVINHLIWLIRSVLWLIRSDLWLSVCNLFGFQFMLGVHSH